jgi:hypothetical protein
MRYLILLLSSSLVGCANRCSEESYILGRTGGTGGEFMEQRGRWPEKSFGTTVLGHPVSSLSVSCRNVHGKC